MNTCESIRKMKWSWTLGCAVLACAQCPLGAANAAPRTYSYIITHRPFGAIGTYERTIDIVGDDTSARSRLDITVKAFSIVVHRETADQTEFWHGKRLMSFRSVTFVDGQQLLVRGEALENRFAVTSSSGTALAPSDIAASDPLSLDRTGLGTVVSLKTGEITPAEVTGGEADTVMRLGVSEPTRHFHVNTPMHADQWQVWFDRQGVPIKFCTYESSGPVNFTLVSPPQVNDVSNHLVLVKNEPMSSASPLSSP
jgi:hypothetical protein